MKKIICIMGCVMLLVAVGMFARPFSAAMAATTYAVDSFTRSVTNGWGSTSPGGTWQVVGDATKFAVPAVLGQMKLDANRTLSAYLPVSARDVEITFRTKRDKPVTTGSHITYFAVRRTTDGTSYLGRIRYGTDGAVHLEAMSEVGGVQTDISGEKIVPNVTTAANTYIWVKAQFSGVNPTTIRIKAWAVGQSEPTTWLYTATDSTAVLQNAGGVGVRAYLAAVSTNAPVLFLFDDLSVTDIPIPPTPTATPPPTATPQPRANSIYWGALVQGQAPSPANLAVGGVFDTFEQRAGKQMAILHWGQPWKMNSAYQPFQAPYFEAVRSHGSIPYLDWSSWNLTSGINQPDFQLSDVYKGTYDSYITQWAQDAKAWGHPFFLRLDWEMNGNWQFPWSEQLNGNQPGDYVKMWRHVHDIFTQNGVSNVTWVWCPNVGGSTTLSFSEVYPGDSYVDWTCLDGYNKYSTWLNFNQVYNAVGINWLEQSYSDLLAVAPSKPIMIGEIASLEAGDGGAKKAAWIRDAYLTQLPQFFPKIKAVVWFNWDDGNPAYTFPIESSQASIDAFAQGVGSVAYPANVYGNLNTSPIPALP